MRSLRHFSSRRTNGLLMILAVAYAIAGGVLLTWTILEEWGTSGASQHAPAVGAAMAILGALWLGICAWRGWSTSPRPNRVSSAARSVSATTPRPAGA